MSLVAEAANGHEAIQQFRAHRPDITLMDLQMPEMNGLGAMLAIRSEFSEARIIVLTTYTGDIQVLRALKAGARAYLLKNLLYKELLETIRAVHAGKKSLSPEVSYELAEHATDDALRPRGKSMSSDSHRSGAEFERGRLLLVPSPLHQSNVHKMIRRRCRQAGIQTQIGCHSFRATGSRTTCKTGDGSRLPSRWPGMKAPGPPSGLDGICDRNALAAAVARPQSGYYEDVIQAGAVLCEACCRITRLWTATNARLSPLRLCFTP
jgi:CheY-like chemotaxis protein